MSAPAKPLVLITGASKATLDRTSRQGEYVANALIHDGNFRVRALTRFPQDDHAKEWKSKGVEICEADMNKKEDVIRALKGVDFAFLITDFWEVYPTDPSLEITHGRVFVDASKEVGLKHLIFSSLERPEGSTDIPAPMLRNKAVIVDYMRVQQVPFTELRIPFLVENFRYFLPPTATETGLEFQYPLRPGTRLDIFSAKDLGPLVVNILQNPSQFLNKSISLVSESYTADELSRVFSKVAKCPVKFTEVSEDNFAKKSGQFGGDQWTQIFTMFNAHSGKLGNVQETRPLFKGTTPTSLENWLQESNWLQGPQELRR